MEAEKPQRRVINIDDGPKIDLDIDPDMVDFIILRAREFDVKVPETDPDDGSNPTDDNDLSILEDDPDDLTETELRDAIDGLSDDAAHDLVALYWIGRGDFTPAAWKAARGQSIERADRASIASYLMGEPNLSDFLEDGMSQTGNYATSNEVERTSPDEDA